MIVDAFLTYQFIKRYVLPFKRWKAYSLGIIDEHGKVLRKRSTLTTEEERQAFGTFDVLVLNMKKATMSGTNPIVPAAITVLLMKEDVNQTEVVETMANLMEDDAAGVPTNSIGDGHIQGAGIGPKGEPGKRTKTFKKMKDILTRKVPK